MLHVHFGWTMKSIEAESPTQTWKACSDKRNIHDLSQVQYVIREQRGKIYVVPQGPDHDDGNLLLPAIGKSTQQAKSCVAPPI